MGIVLPADLLHQNPVHYEADNLQDDQYSQHIHSKSPELSDRALGFWSIQQLVQLLELLGACKFLMTLVIHLRINRVFSFGTNRSTVCVHAGTAH